MKPPLASSMLLVGPLLLITTSGAEGQTPPQNPNFVDTITVGRLPTGGCEWHAAARRMRPGKPGTLTTAGPLSERTCTVIFYNYTTGESHEPPGVDAFGYVQDRKQPLPSDAVLNFADTFTVARRPDGNCDWGKTPHRPGKPGSSSFLSEVRTIDCWIVIYNVTRPPPDTTGMKTSTSISLPPHIWEGPDTLVGRGRQARDIANAASAVLPKSARIEQMTIQDDSLASVLALSPGSSTDRYFYSLRKSSSTWVTFGNPAPFPGRR